jgi:glycosyltransferase involved in cell wall biosynthesis
MKLSIVIPVYNEQARLGDCIKYLESQTVKPEVIFVDGGSRDNTVGVVKEAMKTNKNFRLAAEKGPKRSVANASNTGWKMAAGEILLVTGVDTAMEPDFTKKVVREFEKHPDADLIKFYSKPMPPKRFKSPVEKAMFYKDERGEGRLLIFRTGISKTAGMYDPGLGFGDDKNFWRKVLSKEKVLDVKTELKFSKSATLDLKGIAVRYMWYGRTMPRYLKGNKDSRTMVRAFLAAIFVILVLTFWIHPYLAYLALLMLLLPAVRGVAFGIRLYKLFGVKSPITVLPFTEILGFFFVGIGVFKYLLGDKAVGR